MPETTDALPPSLDPRGAGTGHPPRHHAAPGGLSGAAAVVLLLLVCLGFALGTAMTGNAYGQVFQVAFLLVTLYVALRVRVADLFVAMVAPPLVWALSMAVSATFDSTVLVRSFDRVAINTVSEMALHAPWVVAASVASVVICAVRRRRAHRKAH